VNGSSDSPRRRREAPLPSAETDEHTTISASTSEDLALDTPTSSDDQSQDAGERECPVGVAERGYQSSANGLNVVHGKSPGASPLVDAKDGTRAPDVLIGSQVKPTTLPWSLGRQLSAVEEVRTPSPGLESLYGAPISPTRAKMEALQIKNRQEDKAKAIADSAALSSRSNGVAPGVQGADTGPAVTPSSWQTQKKKNNKKKTVKSENDSKGMNESGGEFMPVDESQRKGG
jgi:hypothetical protein